MEHTLDYLSPLKQSELSDPADVIRSSLEEAPHICAVAGTSATGRERPQPRRPMRRPFSGSQLMSAAGAEQMQRA